MILPRYSILACEIIDDGTPVNLWLGQEIYDKASGRLVYVRISGHTP